MGEWDGLATEIFDAIPDSKAAPLFPVIPPEIKTGLAAELYHADTTSVGIGGLSRMRRSPRHHWWSCRRPDVPNAEATPAQRFGSAVHCMVLEPQDFGSRFVAKPDGLDRRTKAGKEAWDAFEPTIAGRNVLSAAEMDSVAEIAALVRETPLAQELLGGEGKREASVYWSDKTTGARCRCRPDFAPDGAAILIDLKCTEDASDAAIGRTAVNLGWPMRAAWYVDGWKAATGEKREYVYFAWEKDAPYCCAAYFVDDDVLEAGRGQYRSLLGRYAECLAKDEWPGYFEQVQPLLMPAWFTGEK